MHAGMRRPPTITCGRALRTGRIRPRASGLSASLFQDGAQERGALHFAGVAGPQAGDPDGYAVDFAVALPAEPADLTERVEPAGMWAQADVARVPIAGAAARRVADPCVHIAAAAAPQADDTTVPTACAVAPRQADRCAQVAGAAAPRPAADKSAWTARAGSPARADFPPRACRSGHWWAEPVSGWQRAAESW